MVAASRWGPLVVEFILIFALGALAAGLVFLALLPALWQRAVRLSTQRLELQLPLSMKEIYAERDQLRAQAAVEVRQMELSLQRCEEQKAQLMSDVGKKINEVAVRSQEVERLHARLADMEKQIEEANYAEASLVRLGLSQMGHDIVALMTVLEAQMGTSATRQALQLAQQKLAAAAGS
jgi:tetrahydromethanopterin S-methyltransferase subunit G